MISSGKKLTAALAWLACAGGAVADPEIMVHEGDLAERGELVATLHANHTLRGDKTTRDGTWPVDKMSYVMAEFATGLAPGWEAGIHLPVMRAGVDSPSSRRGDWGESAIMFRLKHIRHAAGGWYYGFNAEYDINSPRFVADKTSIELRGIAGYDGEHFRLVANPHLMWGYGQAGADRRPDFNVDFKAMHKLSGDFAWGLEAYLDWGKLAELNPGAGDRTLYLVGEMRTAGGSLHVGIGQGFKETPEKYVIKAVWSESF